VNVIRSPNPDPYSRASEATPTAEWMSPDFGNSRPAVRSHSRPRPDHLPHKEIHLIKGWAQVSHWRYVGQGGRTGRCESLAYVTRIGPADAQVEYRLIANSGCGSPAGYPVPTGGLPVDAAGGPGTDRPDRRCWSRSGITPGTWKRWLTRLPAPTGPRFFA
jgi:hypothetical protein